MNSQILPWLLELGLPIRLAEIIGRSSGLIITLLLVGLTYRGSRWLINKHIIPWIEKTDFRWDDYLYKHSIIHYFYWLIPLILFYLLLPFSFRDLWGVYTIPISYLVTQIALIILITFLLIHIINAMREAIEQFPFAREMPVASFAQILKILVYVTGGLIAISIFLSERPWVVLSSFGALAAVLSFVYQDALRGLVAGIQLTWNNLLAKGDWIEMPAFNVSGTVMEIGLTTVKIQNFDYSVTAVPTNALITSALKNWRGMMEAEGRRMIRALIIDAHTVRFCDEQLYAQLQRLDLIRDYITDKRQEIEAAAAKEADPYNPANTHPLTNLGAFRTYFYNYVHHHPQINTDMTLIVSVLPQTETGIPVQLLAFSREKAYADFVRIQGEIFEHLMAVLPQFGLRLYQAPSGIMTNNE